MNQSLHLKIPFLDKDENKRYLLKYESRDNESLENVGIDGDIVQVAVSKGRQIGDLHMLMAQNPIFIINGGGDDE